TVGPHRPQIPGLGSIGQLYNLHAAGFFPLALNAARDGTVLDRVLNGFNGVLVSDFYSIYDAPACEQQNCVVHFVRDLNDDLKQHPLDVELAALARGFTGVFTPIIATIDRHGLAHHYLKKHKSDAEKYLTQISGCEYKSKVAISYQRRLGKYGARMFTFLSHDSVAWNNNAAENAIKLFAARRKVIGGGFSERGIGDYLLFLSIFCTLRRKGGSFLKFLRSGQKDIDGFLGERRRRIEACPIGTQPLALPQNSLENTG
ncbi:MAG: transposase, partial [Tepidisphaeraceae bacterium]